MFLSLNDAIPFDRDAVGLEGIKESLKRLKRGEMVVMFPEGTRSSDGELLPFKPGFDLLARRTKSRLLPIALDGCYKAFPRDALLPKFGEIRVVIGEPIEYNQYKDWSPEETRTILENRVAELLATARRKIAGDDKIADDND